MVPPLPPAGATGSEHDIFKLLERTEAGDAAIVFTSLNLSDHEYKKWGEIDFVIVTPEGLLAIEVKGGQVHCDERGIWRYESRGKRPIERAESPMAQVSSAYFALRDKYLYPHLDRKLVDAAPTGFGVIFARTSQRDAINRGIIGGTEMPAEIVATLEDLDSVHSITEMLSRFYSYWRSKSRRTLRRWTKDEVATIAGTMRPWFDRVIPLSLSAARVREEQLSLTVEQYGLLDFCDRSDRVLCTGGAGCGKTLIAVECLRREMHRDPILVTGTESLAAHLQASLVPDRSRVISFSELLKTPPSARHTYGCLIVDEGQQLTNPNALNVLSSIIRGGLKSGRWRWFSDPNNQVLEDCTFDKSSQQYLESLAFVGSLTRNCRNTPQIVSTVETVTGASIGSQNVRGQGPEVIFAAAPDPKKQIESAAATIRKWLQDPEIAPGEIVLVSTRAINESSIPEISRLAGIPWKNWAAGWNTSPFHRQALAAATINEFRGLEAPFIVICDVDKHADDPVKQLYLGMTRANFGLFVMADHDVITRAVTTAAQSKITT
ncbi:nuclease-related domain-containing protein [Vogesella amnigena]|uniref:Nuclease-related domain-containing protein n=1 Tax=Vogesella amnigena TaxID=1507449 RepID=A0ABV7TR80_9NEIS